MLSDGEASDSDDVMIASSNRAKKPKRRAKYMSAGLLDTSDGPRMYRKVCLLEHGYNRGSASVTEFMECSIRSTLDTGEL